MAQTHTLYDMLRIHDTAMYNFIGGIRVDYGELSGDPLPDDSILRIFAAPGNAFATMSQYLIRKGWIQRPTSEEQLDAASAWKLVPLPMATLYREAPENDPARANVPAQFRQFLYDSDEGTLENHPYPGMYLINYTVDFWMLKKYTEAYIYEWVMAQLGRLGAGSSEVMIPVDHGDPWGVKIQGARMTSMVDNSDLEVIEADRRYLRWTATYELNSILFRTSQDKTKPVLFMALDFYDTTYADNRYNRLGEYIGSSYCDMDPFPDDGSVPSSKLHLIFDKSGDPQVSRSFLTSDGRFDPFDKKQRYKKKRGSWLFDFPDAGSLSLRRLQLPSGQHFIAIRYRYKSTAAHKLSVTDTNGNAYMTWEVPASSRWKQFETLVWAEGHIAVKWETTGPNQLYIDHPRYTFQPRALAGDPILPATDQIVGGKREVTFSGLNWRKAYMVRGTGLNAASDFDIVTYSGSGLNEEVDRIPVKTGEWVQFSTVSSPMHLSDSIRITFEDPSATTASIEAFEFRGDLLGRFVPV